MNSKDYQIIDKHLHDKFLNINAHSSPESLLSLENIKENDTLNVAENIMYNVPLALLSVSITDINSLLNNIPKDVAFTIINEFIYGVSRILEAYHVTYIKIERYQIIGLFNVKNKQDIQNAMDCAIEINTFNYHFNKRINGDISKQLEVHFSISLTYSENNYLASLLINHQLELLWLNNDETIKCNQEQERSIVFDNFIKSNLLDKDIINAIELFKENDKTYYRITLHYSHYLKWINTNI